jgi:hypothetical protein
MDLPKISSSSPIVFCSMLCTVYSSRDKEVKVEV